MTLGVDILDVVSIPDESAPANRIPMETCTVDLTTIRKDAVAISGYSCGSILENNPYLVKVLCSRAMLLRIPQAGRCKYVPEREQRRKVSPERTERGLAERARYQCTMD